MTRKLMEFCLFICGSFRVIKRIWIIRFGIPLLLSNHRHNGLGNGGRRTLEDCVGVRNIVKSKRSLVHEILGVGNFTILNVIDLISDPLCPCLRLNNVKVRSGNVLKFFFKYNCAHSGSINNKK